MLLPLTIRVLRRQGYDEGNFAAARRPCKNRAHLHRCMGLRDTHSASERKLIGEDFLCMTDILDYSAVNESSSISR